MFASLRAMGANQAARSSSHGLPLLAGTPTQTNSLLPASLGAAAGLVAGLTIAAVGLALHAGADYAWPALLLSAVGVGYVLLVALTTARRALRRNECHQPLESIAVAGGVEVADIVRGAPVVVAGVVPGAPPPESELVFTVNGKEQRLTNPSPSLLLADYLRNTLGLTGTKVGCGEGGCGACTCVAVGADGVPRAINACLRLLCACDGLAITTVEGFGSQERGFSDAQKAIADGQGSQCGFCTPGWVGAMQARLASCYAMLCHAMPCHAMPCHAMLCYAMLCSWAPSSYGRGVLRSASLPHPAGAAGSLGAAGGAASRRQGERDAHTHNLTFMDPPPSAAQAIETALDGNLCRCTGYRPILQASSWAPPYGRGVLLGTSLWAWRPPGHLPYGRGVLLSTFPMGVASS